MKKKLIFFSGAGMSAESGINTFRDHNGLWEEKRIEEVATPEAWMANPDLVSTFYNERRKNVIDSHPNEGHLLIVQMENYFDVQVITQNVDDLHERAGSTNVLHLHGNIRLAKSSGPNQEKCYYPIEGWQLRKEDCCPEGYRLRPHVVWFGEDVPMFAEAIDMVQTADIFVVIGTSLLVYPAADLVHYVPYGCEAYLIDPNAEISGVPKNFQFINHTAVQGMQLLFEKLTSLVDP